MINQRKALATAFLTEIWGKMSHHTLANLGGSQKYS